MEWTKLDQKKKIVKEEIIEEEKQPIDLNESQLSLKDIKNKKCYKTFDVGI